MKQSVRKCWNIGGFTSLRRVTWKRYVRNVGRIGTLNMRKHNTRGITLLKAMYLLCKACY